MSGADDVGDATEQSEGDPAVEDASSPDAGADDLDGGEIPDITTDGPIGDPAEAELDGDLVEMVEVAEKIAAERDEYLDMARRVQAEFENYKRRVDAQHGEMRQRAAENVVNELLPVLDAGEAASNHGAEEAAALHAQLLATLEKLGLTRVADTEVDFDPNVHEAVMHEEGDGGDPVVAETLRAGYQWNSRVLRPAMVKVRG